MIAEIQDGLPALDERPLVTFALFAYNQEKYIREAIEGALAQTYEPLEIILTDDCSTDGTFTIMEEMAHNYEGTHSIKVRKNSSNKGTLAHVIEVAQEAQGTIFVVAAGDDISLPQRTEIIVSFFLNGDFYAASSHDLIIDENGVERDLDPGRIALRGEWHNENSAWIHGATAAYSTKFIANLHTPKEKILYEDMVFTDLLSLMNKKAALIKIPLVKYRHHFENISNRKTKKPSIEITEQNSVVRWRRAAAAKGYCIEEAIIQGIELQGDSLKIYKKIILENRFFLHISKWMENRRLSTRMKTLYYAIKTRNLKTAIIRIFGFGFFKAIRKIKSS